MRRQTRGGRKYDKNDDSDATDDFDFSLQLQQEGNIGKRTGKVIKEKNWKKNDEGFYDVEFQVDDSLTPQTKIAQLKQFLGLHREEEESLKNKSQLSSQDNQQSLQQQRHQPRKKKSPPKRTSRQSNVYNNNKRMTRRTQFQFSFSFDLDDNLNDNLMEASFSSEQTDFDEDYNMIHNSKRIRKSDKASKSKNEEQSVVQTKKQHSQNEQRLKRLSLKEEQQYKKNNLNKQTKEENKKIISKQQSKSISLQLQQVERKSNKLKTEHSLVEQQRIQFNIQQGKQSMRKNFKDISEIKVNQKSLDFSIDNDLMLGSFLGQIENNPSNSETAGELNKAVINTQTQNTKQDDEKETKEKEFQYNKKSKLIMEKQQKQKKNLIKNSQSDLEDENKKSFQKEQERKNALPKNKKNKQNYFLTESLRKQAHFYYEKQKKQNQQKQNLLNKKKQPGKRQIQFQNVETKDLLDQQKLMEMRQKSEHEKGLKKVKNNEPSTKIQKSEKDKGKVSRQENVAQKRSKKFSFERIQERASEQYEEDDYIPEYRSKQQKIKVNNRVVKQADKALKRKDRPERVSPVQRKAVKKPQTMSLQKKPNTHKLGSRAKTEVQKLMMSNKNYSIIIDDSMMQSGRKYPKRHRFGRVQAWKGQKIIYDLDGNAVQVQSKQLIRLIGLLNQSSLDSEITLVKSDRYVQKILLQPRQIVEFEGFDDKYRQLHITYIRKSKGNYDKVNRTVQVLQDKETTKLIEPKVIDSNSGRFIIMNKGEDSAYLQLVLFKNEDFEI